MFRKATAGNGNDLRGYSLVYLRKKSGSACPKSQSSGILLFPANFGGDFYVKASLDLCKQRAPTGLFQKALPGEIKEFTRISAPYEATKNPEIALETDQLSVKTAAQKIMDYLLQKNMMC